MKKYRIQIIYNSDWIPTYYDNNDEQYWKIQEHFLADLNNFISDIQDNIKELNITEQNIKYESFELVNANVKDGYLIIKLLSDLSTDEIKERLYKVLDYHNIYDTYYTLYFISKKQSSSKHSHIIGGITRIDEEE